MMSRFRKLRLETLESKDLLAGDVMASLSGGDLLITGDADSNNISIIRNGAAAGEVTVVGNGGTTIDSEPSESFVVTGDVIIDLTSGGENVVDFAGDGSLPSTQVQLPGNVFLVGGAGTDNLKFTNAFVAGDVSFEDSAGGQFSFLEASEVSVISGDYIMDSAAGGSEVFLTDSTVSANVVVLGDSSSQESFLGISGSTVGGDVHHYTDSITSVTQLQNVEVGDDLRIRTGEGSDLVTLSDFAIGDDLEFRGGDGDDIFFVNPVGTINTVGDDLYLTGGEGGDSLAVEDVEIGDKLRISAGSGDDEVVVANSVVGSSALVSLGSGINEAEVVEVDAGRSLTIVGRGANDIFLETVESSHFVTIITSNGDDVVNMADVSTHSAMVATKSGADEVSITESEFDYLFVLLGSGNDTLTLEGVTVDRFALLSGGSGSGDELVDNGDNDINFAIDFAFESGSI